jgi:hypothetical protein
VDAYFGTGSTAIKGISSGPIKNVVAAFNASETVKILRDTTVPVVLAILGPLLPTDLKSVAPAGVPGLPLPSGLPFP